MERTDRERNEGREKEMQKRKDAAELEAPAGRALIGRWDGGRVWR